MTANIQRQLEYAEPLSRSHNTMLNHLTEANTLNHLKGKSRSNLIIKSRSYAWCLTTQDRSKPTTPSYR